MPLKFCANLSFMFCEESCSLIERYSLAKCAGFKAVECANPYSDNINDIVLAKNSSSLKQILINTPVNVSKHELGYAALGAASKNAFLDGIQTAIEVAKELDCKQIHIMSGIVKLPTVDNKNNLLNNLKMVKPLFESNNVIGLIEPISKQSVPDYYLNNYETAVDIIKDLNSDNFKLLLDIFHLQRINGNLTESITNLLQYTNHIQIAQVPLRNEPNTAGEIDYKYVLSLLEKLGYDGYIGLEYHPANGTLAGLTWLQQFGYSLDI